MSRYHVDTAARLVLVQVTLDQEFSLRDSAGNPTPRERIVFKAGAVGPAAAMGSPQERDLPGTHWPLIDGADGSAALQIAELASIDVKLGRTVSGVALPTVASLVQVTRPREHSRLPAGVRDKLDDQYIDSELNGMDAAGQPLDTPAARGAIASELQGRAAAALARKDARGSQAALEDAIGIGRSQ